MLVQMRTVCDFNCLMLFLFFFLKKYVRRRVRDEFSSYVCGDLGRGEVGGRGGRFIRTIVTLISSASYWPEVYYHIAALYLFSIHLIEKKLSCGKHIL